MLIGKNFTEERSLQARIAWAVYRSVVVRPSSDDLRSLFNSEQRMIQRELTLKTLYDEPGVVESRRVFKAISLDPARYRPSQEALLRRVIAGKEMYFINSGVDTCNILSIRYRLPMGLYNLEKIHGPLTLRVGSERDVYQALNGREVNCAGKFVLADDAGAIGGPYVDSTRTAVTLATKEFLHVVYFCHPGLSNDVFEDMISLMTRVHGGNSDGYQFIEI